ncbi:aminopeptidase N-like isoform X2 [Dreissena polymorpha]|uniref:aminopeptidase N-like isoform X2 n=1 Tax=Dreissena polymorpha TaxID=45954 RepID=UPI002263B50D|nr:aminopeptidase N-like isoform X2 [Dreissena polymorpha]
MPGNNYELEDVTVKYKSDMNSESGSAPRDRGMYVSTSKAFILAFLAIAIAVGVGIIVHFAGPGSTFECKCTYPTSDSGSSSAAMQQCKDWAAAGQVEICSACPAATQTPCPSTASTSSPAPTQPPVSTTGATIVTTQAPSSTPKPTVKDVRIPLHMMPIKYTVELQVFMYAPLEPAEFYFNGSVVVSFECKNATDMIYLHSNKLNYTGSFDVKTENGLENLYSRHTFDLDRQFLIVHMTEKCAINKNYTLEIPHFRGPLAADLAGLYLSSYTRENKTIHIATSQMQPTDARKTFPCMDEPAIKAQFEVTLVRKSHMVSISNMPIISNASRADDWFADKFAVTPKMSTYLLAFIICDFNYTENTTENDVTYRAYARPDAVDQTPYSLETGVKILTFFEKYFNVTYPLPKQDMIAIPDFSAGAMENWGLITYRETAMLYQPGVSSAGNKQRVAVVVSHELAHQWFGNLVTPSWWDDLWLNEGFASYVEYMGVDHVHPDWKMFEQFVVEDLQDVFNFDGLISSHPVYVPVAHPDEINEIFDRISYAKGASIIRMMRFFLGDDNFQKGLTNYLRSLEYGAAFHDDLWYALGNRSDFNVKEVMDTWTLQMNYPTVMVSHSQTGQITLTQSRYLQDPKATDPGKYVSPFGYKWYIPFTYTTSSRQRFNVTSNDVKWLNKTGNSEVVNDTDILAPGVGWVLGNPMQYGYYRVNYDITNWNMLIQQLVTDHKVIHAINRAQIINDAWSLAQSGDLAMEVALQTTNYLDKEREYVPWAAASSQLSFVNSMLARHPLYGSFRKFMRNKTEDTFNELTMNNTNALHLDSYVRSAITDLACTYGIQECINEAKRLFRQWKNNPDDNPVDPGIKSTVYCTAVAEGTLDDWEFALARYRVENLAAEKSRLLSALACSRESWVLSRYLQMAIDQSSQSEIRRQDAVSVIVYISRNTIGRSLAWDLFRDKWDFFLNEHGRQLYAFTRLISGVTDWFNSPQKYQELQAFIASKNDLGSGARAFDQALEKTRSNIKWMVANVPVIQTWLQSQGF